MYLSIYVSHNSLRLAIVKRIALIIKCMLKFAKSSLFCTFHKYELHLKICIAIKLIKKDTRVIINITYVHVSIRVSGYETGKHIIT